MNYTARSPRLILILRSRSSKAAENAGQFLGGLDLLIEECDDPQVKRELRFLAKERGVNLTQNRQFPLYIGN